MGADITKPVKTAFATELVCLQADPKEGTPPELHLRLEDGSELHVPVSWWVLRQLKDMTAGMNISPNAVP